MVELMPHDQEVVGSNQGAGLLFDFLSSLSITIVSLDRSLGEMRFSSCFLGEPSFISTILYTLKVSVVSLERAVSIKCLAVCVASVYL